MENDGKALTDREIEEQKNIAAFKEEAFERLSELENALLELEESPQNQDLIDRAFRAMHTIKGSGGMFGFDQIVEFTHDIETVFDKVRDGEIKISNELIALTLSAHDQIKMMLEDTDVDLEEKSLKRNEITSNFLKYLPDINPKKDEVIQESSSKLKNLKNKITTYRIRFRPQHGFFKTGSNPGLLLHELSEMGQCKIIAHTEAIPLLMEIDPELCYTWWDIILGTDKEKNDIEDVFIFVDDNCEVLIEVIDTDTGLENNDSYKRLGEILVDRGD
ncbi:Hpt domain-containing protein, partial [bacterium]|nr:Hpt domain-containing protein [bacterium]